MSEIDDVLTILDSLRSRFAIMKASSVYEQEITDLRERLERAEAAARELRSGIASEDMGAAQAHAALASATARAERAERERDEARDVVSAWLSHPLGPLVPEDAKLAVEFVAPLVQRSNDLLTGPSATIRCPCHPGVIWPIDVWGEECPLSVATVRAQKLDGWLAESKVAYALLVKQADGWQTEYDAKLAASQARERELRSALERAHACATVDSVTGKCDGCFISALLSAPADTSALRAFGEKVARGAWREGFSAGLDGVVDHEFDRRYTEDCAALVARALGEQEGGSDAR